MHNSHASMGYPTGNEAPENAMGPMSEVLVIEHVNNYGHVTFDIKTAHVTKMHVIRLGA